VGSWLGTHLKILGESMHASGAPLLPEASRAHPARPMKLSFYPAAPSGVVSSVCEDQAAQAKHDARGTEPSPDVGDVIERVLDTPRRCILAADVQSILQGHDASQDETECETDDRQTPSFPVGILQNESAVRCAVNAEVCGCPPSLVPDHSGSDQAKHDEYRRG